MLKQEALCLNIRRGSADGGAPQDEGVQGETPPYSAASSWIRRLSHR